MDQHVGGERGEHRAGGTRAAARELGRTIERVAVVERGEQRGRGRAPTGGRGLRGPLCTHAERPEEEEVVEADDVLDDVGCCPLGARCGRGPRIGRDRVRDVGESGAGPTMPLDHVVHGGIIHKLGAGLKRRWTPAARGGRTHAVNDDLHKAAFLPDLLVAALNRHPDRPGRVPRRPGADRARGRGADELLRAGVRRAGARRRAARSSMLSPNRPEVLFTLGANMVTRLPRRRALHPLGLGRRPRVRDRRRRDRDARLRPELRRARAGSCSERVPEAASACSRSARATSATTCSRSRRSSTPQPLVAPNVDAEDVAGLRLHRRHDRQAQGRDGHVPQRRDDDA